MKKLKLKELEKRSCDVNSYWVSPVVEDWLLSSAKDDLCYLFGPKNPAVNGSEFVSEISRRTETFCYKKQYVPIYMVRDLYRYLTGRAKWGKVTLNSRNYPFYISVITNPHFRVLCELCEGREILSKIMMQYILARFLRENLISAFKRLSESEAVVPTLPELPELEEEPEDGQQSPVSSEQSKGQQTELPRSDAKKDKESGVRTREVTRKEGEEEVLDTSSKSKGEGKKQKKEEQEQEQNWSEVGGRLSMYATSEETAELASSVSNRIDVILCDAIKVARAGLERCKISFSGKVVPKEVVKSKHGLRKIMNTLRSVAGEMLSEMWVTRNTSELDPTDPVIADDTLLTLRALEQGFIGKDRFAKLLVDIYLDVSGSMGNYGKYEVALGACYMLKRYGVRFKKVFLFGPQLYCIQRFEDALLVRPGGGTRFEDVYVSILKRRNPAIVVSDMWAGDSAPNEKEGKCLLKYGYYIRVDCHIYENGKYVQGSEWEKYFNKVYAIDVLEVRK